MPAVILVLRVLRTFYFILSVILLDVGGGSVSSEEAERDGCLFYIPLRWIVEEVVESKCGILFDAEAMCEYDINIYTDEESQRTFREYTGNS